MVKLAVAVWFILALGLGLSAQPAESNQVLDLDGSGAFVELPSAAMEGLSELTVDFWARWRRFDPIPQRVFNFGAPLRDISVAAQPGGGLWFVKAGSRGELFQLRQALILQSNLWHHITATSAGDAPLSEWIPRWFPSPLSRS
ncbi:MAG: LamG domain-containing protein [Verrucomicrobia bacterium]|nr:LamG domain-containing protein [Verrucomicrobiota bacterium]